jgi:hypothetical protein
MQVEIPVSIGELVDKITILKIKQSQIKDPYKIANVELELELLTAKLESLNLDPRVCELEHSLLIVNRILWDIENSKREHEHCQKFDSEFIDLARNVYKYNDRRAEIKREINLLVGSKIVEEKSYRST